MRRTIVPILALLVLAASATGCSTGDTGASDRTGTAEAGTDVAAYLGDEPITNAEVERLASAELDRLAEEVYQRKVAAVRSIAIERVLTERAAAEGLNPQQYLEREVDANVPSPSSEEIREIYDRLKDTEPALQGRSFEDAEPLIAQQLVRQRADAERRAYFDRLLDEQGLRILVDPPRYDVAVPVGEPARGREDAPVTIVEFSDYECGYCKRAHPTVERLLEEFGDEVRFVYRDYALDFHTRARPAALAARCAGDQGKYWEYHADLMESPGRLDDVDLNARAERLELDLEAFKACVADERHLDAVDASIAAGEALGVSGTPTFFINGRRLVGAQPYENLKQLVEEELERRG